MLTPTGVTIGPRHTAWLEWNEVARVDTGGLHLSRRHFVGTDKFVMARVKRYIHDKDRRRRIGTEAELERITR